MLKNLKNNKKKGFTLVELIVVLVILAILAALLIPALTGYIDKAKDKSIIAETRQIVMAAQTLADEEYAKNGTQGISIVKEATEENASAGEITTEAIMKLADITEGEITVSGTGNDAKTAIDTDGKITKLEFTHSGKVCQYLADGKGKDGKYTVTKATK